MQVFRVNSSLALNSVVYTIIYTVLGFCLVYIVCFRNSADSGGYVDRRNPSLSCYSLLTDYLEQDISCAVMHALYDSEFDFI